MISRFFSRTYKAVKYSMIVASFSSVIGYLYLSEINYRLRDTQQMNKSLRMALKANFENSGEKLTEIGNEQYELYEEISFLCVKLVVGLNKILEYREYERKCLQLKQLVIEPVLQNYRQNSMFDEKGRRALGNRSKNIKSFDEVLFQKFSSIKEQNTEISNLYTDLIKEVREKQLKMNTYDVVSLTKSDHEKIDLLFQYLIGVFQMLEKNKVISREQREAFKEISKGASNDYLHKVIFL